MEQTNISSDKPGWIDEAAVEYDYSENGTSNVTSLDSYKISIVYPVIVSMIFVIGIVGNVLIIIVLTKPRNRNSSTAVLYMCLAVSDLVIILTATLTFLIFVVFDFNFWHKFCICNVMNFIVQTFWENSSWVIVIITLERVVSVILPFRAKYICRPRNALLVSMSVLTLLLCSNVIELYGQDGQCNIRSDVYENYANKYYIYKSALLVGLVPAIITASGNIVIYRTLSRQSIARDNYREEVIAVTRTTVLVTAAFLITQLPLLINECLLQLGFSPVLPDLTAVLIILSDVNAALNFILYMLQGSRFRAEVRRMFVCQ